jgi:hypothetical protein
MFTINKTDYYPILLILGVSVGLGAYICGIFLNNIQIQALGAFWVFFTIITGTVILAIKMINAGTKVGDER